MNYNDISTLALSYADRQDLEVTSRIDNFLKIVEARVNRKLQTLKMSVLSYTTVTTAEFYSLPIDYLSIRSIKILANDMTSNRTNLQYINSEQMSNAINNKSQGYYYTIISNKFNIYPSITPGYVLEIDYYQKVPELTSSSITNWLSETNPDVYVFGVLVEISAFVKDANSKALWDDRFEQAISEIVQQDSSSTWSGTSLHTNIG